MRVIIATDLSEASLAAVESVTTCSPVDFSAVVLVHAVDLDLYTAGGTVPAVLELAEQSLGEIAESLRASGFEVAVRAEVGPATEVIERVAAEEDIDLVVMSNLGKGAVSGRLLGSTAENIASSGRLPVLIERVREDAGAWCRIAERHPFGKVLVGADLSESLREQLALVGRLPGLGAVRVLHVTDADADQAAILERVETLIAHARESAMSPEVAIRIGADPASELLAEAAEWEATLIAVSPRTHGLLHRALWGSTARSLAKGGTVPVLFVPPGDEL